MKKYIIHYGSYIAGYHDEEIEAPNDEVANDEAYRLAYEATEGMYGLHGFGVSPEEFREDYDGDNFDEDYTVQMHEDIEAVLDYWIEEV